MDETYDYMTDELIRLGLRPTHSYQVDGGRQITIDGWPEPVTYRQSLAVPVLRSLPDGYAAVGDADMCRRLEAAGAVARIGKRQTNV